jgi:predicted ATPase
VGLAPTGKRRLFAAHADFMSLPGSQRHTLPKLNPQQEKERTREALIRQLEGLGRRQPVAMIFEDAHWIDPTSRELLDLTVERLPGLPVLLIVTFRPEFQPCWIGQPHVTVLALNRLDRRDRTALLTQIAGGKALPDEVVAHIVERTDGVPLFVEELTKSVLESELLREDGGHYVLDGPLPPLAIPTSLHASLTARLDRLGSVRQVAQIGAAIGRWFRYALLRAVSGLPENELQAALTRLVASELVFESGAAPDTTYTFKHVLVQEAAYGSSLRHPRQQLHGRIADALEAHFPDMMESQPEVLARHYASAGLAEKSVFYWSKAAQRSATRSAMAEAAAQFQKALDQLRFLPDDSARQHQELEFLSSLGVALRFAKGLASPETGRALARARELWEQLGSPSKFVQVPYWQSLHHQSRGEFGLAQRLDENLLRLSRKRNDSAGLILGHLSAGRALWLIRRFALSRSHLEEVLAPDDPIPNRLLADQTGTHPHAIAQAYLGNALFCLGHPDQALEQSNAVITKAQRSDNATLLASSLSVGIRLLLLVGNLRALDDWAGQLIAVATEQGFPHWRGREPSIAGGPRSKIVRWRRGYRSSAAVRALTGPPGRRHLCPITSPSWPGHVRSLAKLTRPEPYWTMRCGSSKGRGSAGSQRSCTDTKASCSCGKGIPRPPRSCIAKPSVSPRSREPSCGNCAPPRASPGSAATRVADPKPAIFSRRSTAGSPRASILPI